MPEKVCHQWEPDFILTSEEIGFYNLETRLGRLLFPFQNAREIPEEIPNFWVTFVYQKNDWHLKILEFHLKISTSSNFKLQLWLPFFFLANSCNNVYPFSFTEEMEGKREPVKPSKKNLLKTTKIIMFIISVGHFCPLYSMAPHSYHGQLCCKWRGLCSLSCFFAHL